MKWTLDDNERGAFHYLLGGVAAVLLLKLAALGIDAATRAAAGGGDAAVLLPFRQGYFLGPDLAVVGTPAGRMERIASAVVVAVAASLLLGALAALIVRALRRPTSPWTPGRAGIAVARTALVLTLGWSLYAVLFLPLRTTIVRTGGLVLRERTALIGDVPVPFTLHEAPLPSDRIARIEAVRRPCTRGCNGGLQLVLVRTDGSRDVLAARAGICPAVELDRLREAGEAAALLEREMH